MKKFFVVLAVSAVAMCGVAKADITPASKEGAVKVQTAQVVTNGQTVVIGSGLNVLTGVGSANGSTNTITLVAPSKAGLMAIVAIGSGTNLVAVADSGTAALSAAFVGDTSATLQLISTSTSTWAQVSKSNN